MWTSKTANLPGANISVSDKYLIQFSLTRTMNSFLCVRVEHRSSTYIIWRHQWKHLKATNSHRNLKWLQPRKLQNQVYLHYQFYSMMRYTQKWATVAWKLYGTCEHQKLTICQEPIYIYQIVRSPIVLIRMKNQFSDFCDFCFFSYDRFCLQFTMCHHNFFYVPPQKKNLIGPKRSALF